MTFWKKENNARSTLASGIDNSTTSITVADATSYPTSGNFVLTIWDKTTYPNPGDDSNHEIILVTDIV